MTSKERANLKSLAVKIEPVLQIGKSGITPELTEAVRETFHTRELTKIHILQSCTEDGRILAQTLADRTGSEVVQVIGRMIVLYKKNEELQKKKEAGKEASKQSSDKRAQSKNGLKENFDKRSSKKDSKENFDKRTHNKKDPKENFGKRTHNKKDSNGISDKRTQNKGILKGQKAVKGIKMSRTSAK